MGRRWTNEPPYPRSRAEVDSSGARAIDTLRSHLSDRLVCVLLCGSWARGEARPPDSDVDLTVIVDTVDDAVSDQLRLAWAAASLAPANVYGADEVRAMAREAVEMYTVNAVVLWGCNPFLPPTRQDFAEDLARAAESVARDARVVEFYAWLTLEERVGILTYLLRGKGGLYRALLNLAAMRTGTFPKDRAALRQLLTGSPEGALLTWLTTLTDADCRDQHAVIGRRLSLAARDWLREALSARQP